MAKLQDKYIKTKVRARFGELEVYNVINKDMRSELSKMIKDSSTPVTLENGMSDVKIDNMNTTMRYLLINCTNVENADYWNGIEDKDFEEMLDLSNGDLKDVVNELLDIVFETVQDNRKEEIRKLDVIKEKIIEMTELLKFDIDINKSLNQFGLSKELLSKVMSGDKEAIQQVQKILLEQQPKQKRTRTKKTK